MSSSQPSQPEHDHPLLWLHSHFLLPTGGTKFIFEVVSRLAERRPVEVLVERAAPLWKQRYADAGVTLHEIGGPTSDSLGYWAAFPAFLRRDQRVIDEHASRSSAIVSSFFPMPWLAARAAKRHGLRHVSLCFEPFPFFYDKEVIGLYPPAKRSLLRFLRAAYGWVDSEGVGRADALLTLNRSTAEQLDRVYGCAQPGLTYAGVDTDFFRPHDAAELVDMRRQFGDGPLVVHSTDFSPIKRTDLAVRAFAVAASRVPDARLAITSTRDDPAQLAATRRLAAKCGVEDRVDYLGFLPFEDLPRLYSFADVLLQSGTSVASGATTMSLPVKEAMACGTAVVRSNATEEDVEDGVSGFLVDPLDWQATGLKVASLLQDRSAARAMGEAGRKRILRLYRWDRVVDVVEGALEA